MELQNKKFKPVYKRVATSCIVFIIILSALVSAVTYRIYTTAMFSRYQAELDSVLNLMQGYIDNDDLSQCCETQVESEKYKQLQEVFDNFVDNYNDIHYLYIVDAYVSDEHAWLASVLSANSTYEKLYEPEDILHLGDYSEDWYTRETVEHFLKIQNGSQQEYFENPSSWGKDYSLVRPLVDSSGNHYAALCADISMDTIYEAVYFEVILNIVITFLLSLTFIFLLQHRINKGVSIPIRQLEENVREFAKTTYEDGCVSDFTFRFPEIKTNDEIYLLAQAVDKLSTDIQSYILHIMDVEDENTQMRRRAKQMDVIAYQDVLTKVKNKAAYEKMMSTFDTTIATKELAFGIVMADINYLKRINDKYGHERGDDYIFGTCRTICDVFANSQVYRIGGDEFVVVLQGSDYENREQLLEKLKGIFVELYNDETLEPWERYSASVGMSVYQPGDSAKDVFKRADKAMYAHKSQMKAGRE